MATEFVYSMVPCGVAGLTLREADIAREKRKDGSKLCWRGWKGSGAAGAPNCSLAHCRSEQSISAIGKAVWSYTKYYVLNTVRLVSMRAQALECRVDRSDGKGQRGWHWAGQQLWSRHARVRLTGRLGVGWSSESESSAIEYVVCYVVTPSTCRLAPALHI